MTTKQANLENALSGMLTTGTDGQNRATADLNQTLSGVAGAALRLNALWQDSDVAGRDHVNNSRTGLAPSLGLGLNGDTRAYVNLLDYGIQHTDAVARLAEFGAAIGRASCRGRVCQSGKIGGGDVSFTKK